MIIVPSFELPQSMDRTDAMALAEVIGAWDREGFHRVELSRRGGGRPHFDRWVVEEGLRDLQTVVQVAGGDDDTDGIATTLEAGASFAVLGPRAIDDPDWLNSVSSQFPDQLLVWTPARERRTRSRGAVRTLPLDLRDVASGLSSLALAGMIIEFPPDATFGHAELALLEDVVEDVPFPVMASGGLVDIAALRDLEFRGVAATIIAAGRLSADFDAPSLARSFAD
jgi:phosphoribosylformimino-5-aminoimidazole carboxamide ribotide isomerase